MFVQALMFEIFKINRKLIFGSSLKCHTPGINVWMKPPSKILATLQQPVTKKFSKQSHFSSLYLFPIVFISDIHDNIFFLLQAVGLLKDGGVLVYSTCTITPQENELQVAWALKSFPCLKLARQVSDNLIQLFASL